MKPGELLLRVLSRCVVYLGGQAVVSLLLPAGQSTINLNEVPGDGGGGCGSHAAFTAPCPAQNPSGR